MHSYTEDTPTSRWNKRRRKQRRNGPVLDPVDDDEERVANATDDDEDDPDHNSGVRGPSTPKFSITSDDSEV